MFKDPTKYNHTLESFIEMNTTTETNGQSQTNQNLIDIKYNILFNDKECIDYESTKRKMLSASSDCECNCNCDCTADC